MNKRHTWQDVRDLIEARTGPIRRAEPVSQGRNAEIAVVVYTDQGTCFVKGMREDHPRAWTQHREQQVNPHVLSVSPQLLWSQQADGWHLLGFEYIPGRPVDYTPGSLDLPKLIATLDRLQRIPAPPIELKDARQRWAAYSDKAALFAGDRLLHTEWTPTNVLITDDNAWLVDWAWPTAGADWIDPACLIVWLVSAGHTPQQAEAQVSALPSWRHAPDEAVTEFARVQAQMWRGIAESDGHRWAEDLAAAARAWTEHRT
ncbi:hypothetical protein [Actinomadura rupiterrae]|uniref:hypothetical protein n=1 Tax=Actinomadura rupiterrae TaxID=559627 RepID=UPI0020A2567D|nr:hypothetical protein [Actinomadura rupiterrae]MCP2337383.1 hypothetical protein [Actinomadura rupiterrae]